MGQHVVKPMWSSFLEAAIKCGMQVSVQFELALDQVSCSLEPPRSYLECIPVLSSISRISWKDLFRMGKIRRTKARALEPVLHPLSAVIQSGELCLRAHVISRCAILWSALTHMARNQFCFLNCIRRRTRITYNKHAPPAPQAHWWPSWDQAAAEKRH